MTRKENTTNFNTTYFPVVTNNAYPLIERLQRKIRNVARVINYFCKHSHFVKYEPKQNEIV